MALQQQLKQLMEARASFSRNEARELMHQILTGSPADIQIAALLGALAARGETAAEIAGFAEAMRSEALPLPLTQAERDLLVDTCGTGGDASGTFNISTAAALVAAAAGATVAKHGNRAVTSRCGSADVLEALGIPVNLGPLAAAEALRRHRFAFLHAPSLHPTMRAVMPVRRALGVRTLFNIIGPLTNPAGASRQVMGVFAPHLVPLVGEAMAMLGTRRAMVVHGDLTAELPDDSAASYLGMDELSLSGPSQVAEVFTPARNGTQVRLSTLTPEDAGLVRAPLAALRGGDAGTNAAILTAIFAGQPGPPRDVVVLNAAAVLVTADLAPTLPAAAQLARQAIDSGAVTALVKALGA
ncbi:MAG: anthranilate phosphoribosyltransferase [Acidobacteriota bacterium]|nr:anthranilate phosphoribosyltransferase [Acidobacteriota bacterium]